MLDTWHVASSDGDDCVGAFLTLSCDGYLVANGSNAINSPFVFLFRSLPKGTGTVILEKLSKILDLLVSRVLSDPKIKLRGLASNTSARPHSHAGVSLCGGFILVECSGTGHDEEEEC
jgi:hypothetical protein